MHEEEREVQLQVRCPLSCSASLVIRQLHGEVFFESSYAACVYNSVGSDQMLVLEVAFAQPHGGFPSVSQLRRGIPRSFSHLWK